MDTALPVTRLTPADRHAVHAYYDVCPESPDGQSVAVFQFDGPDVPGPGRGVVLDQQGQAQWQMPAAVEGNGHVGAFFTFAGSQTVACKRAGEQSGITDLFDMKTGRSRALKGDVRQIHPTTGKALFKRFPRENNPYHLAIELAIVDLKDEDRPLATIDTYQAHPICSNCPAAPETLHMQNLKWSPDGSQVLIVYTDEVWRRDRDLPYPKYKVMLVAEADGNNLRWLSHFGHHPAWTPDGSAIIFYDFDSQDRQNLYRVNMQGQRELLSENFPGVHVTQHPNKPWLVTDIHDKGNQIGEVVAFSLSDFSRKTLAKFEHSRFEHGNGFHPHPVISPDGNRLYFNAMDGEYCGVYRMDIESL